MNYLMIILLSIFSTPQKEFNVEPHQVLQQDETYVNYNYDEID